MFQKTLFKIIRLFFLMIIMSFSIYQPVVATTFAAAMPWGNILAPSPNSTLEPDANDNGFVTIMAEANDGGSGSGVKKISIWAKYDGEWHLAGEAAGQSTTTSYTIKWYPGCITPQDIYLGIHVENNDGSYYAEPEDQSTTTIGTESLCADANIPLIVPIRPTLKKWVVTAGYNIPHHGGDSGSIYFTDISDLMTLDMAPVSSDAMGAVVVAAASGTVFTKTSCYFVIQHSNNVYTSYLHVWVETPLNVGETIRQGEIIGRLSHDGHAKTQSSENFTGYDGNCGTLLGYPSGSHLHFMLDKAIAPVSQGEFPKNQYSIFSVTNEPDIVDMLNSGQLSVSLLDIFKSKGKELSNSAKVEILLPSRSWTIKDVIKDVIESYYIQVVDVKDGNGNKVGEKLNGYEIVKKWYPLPFMNLGNTSHPYAYSDSLEPTASVVAANQHYGDTILQECNPQTQSFCDVPSSDKFFPYIESMGRRVPPVANGCKHYDPDNDPKTDNTLDYFCPEEYLSRGQAMKLLGRAFGGMSEPYKENLFTLDASTKADLDKGVLPSAFRQYFDDNQIFLSSSVSVTAFPKEQKWVVKDNDNGGKIYVAVASTDSQNQVVGIKVYAVWDQVFSDLTYENSQFYNWIMYFKEQVHIIDGFSDGTFRQNDWLTRGQWVKMIVGILKNSHLTIKDSNGDETDINTACEDRGFIDQATRNEFHTQLTDIGSLYTETGDLPDVYKNTLCLWLVMKQKGTTNNGGLNDNNQPNIGNSTTHTFDANTNITRAQSSKWLYFGMNLVPVIAQEASEPNNNDPLATTEQLSPNGGQVSSTTQQPMTAFVNYSPQVAIQATSTNTNEVSLVTPGDDWDWVKIIATTTDQINFLISERGLNANIKLQIYDTDLTTLLASSMGYAQSNGVLLQWVPPHTGTFYLKSSNAFEFSLEGSNYILYAQNPTSLITNPSFETGVPTSWNWLEVNQGDCNRLVYKNSSVAYQGNYYLATNKNGAANCKSLYQDVSMSPAAGDMYRFAIWVRSANGAQRLGRIAIWGLGGQEEHDGIAFSTFGSNWQCIETSLTVQNSGHTALRPEIYLDSPDSVDYYFDQAILQKGGNPICAGSNGGPDLKVEKIQIIRQDTNAVVSEGGEIPNGVNVRADIDMLNCGALPINAANVFVVEYYLDGVLVSDDLVGKEIIPTCADKNTENDIIYIAGAGQHTIQICLDTSDVIPENRENNNCGSFVVNTTYSLPGAFSRTSPASGAVNQLLNATLSWGASAGAVSYEYCYSTSNSACTNWKSTGSATSVTLSNLSASTTYYWQARAKNPVGMLTYASGGDTTYWSFTTGYPPGAFNKSIPPHLGTNTALVPNLAWTVSANVTQYEYCVDTTNNNICDNNKWISSGANITALLASVQTENTTYYWQARAVNAFGATEANASVWHSFTTGARSLSFAPTIDNAGTTGMYTSLKLNGSGIPVVSYYDNTNGDLKLALCGNALCTTKTLTTVDSAGDVGLYTSLALNSQGFPVISYYDKTNQDLKVAICGDAACASKTLTTVDGTGSVGHFTSLALNGSGFPVISYYDATGGNVKIAVCGNATCATKSITALSFAGPYMTSTSLALNTNGFPVISYSGVVPSYSDTIYLRLVACQDANCTNKIHSTVDKINLAGKNSSLALGANNFPVIGYFDSTTRDLKLAICGDITCSANTTFATVDNAGFLYNNNSLKLNASGSPVIAYYSGGVLKVATCGNPACTSKSIIVMDNVGVVGEYVSLMLNSNNNPVASYFSNTPAGLKLAFGATPLNVAVNKRTNQSDPAKTSPVTFDAVFSAPVIGFDPDDVSTIGSAAPGALSANISEVYPNDGTTYVVGISGMTGDGNITVSIPAGQIQDVAGNINKASTSTDNIVAYDANSPAVTSITRAYPSPTFDSHITFTVVFSESVEGVGASDFSLNSPGNTGALITNVSGSGATYTVMADAGAGAGSFRLDVPVSATIKDLTGNSLAGLPFTGGEAYTVNKPPVSKSSPLFTSCAEVNRTHGTLIIPPAGNLGMTISNNSDLAVSIKSVTIQFNDIPSSQQIHELYLGGNRLWSQNNVPMDGTYTFTTFNGSPIIPAHTTSMLAVTKWSSETQILPQAYQPSAGSIERIVVKFQPIDSKDPSSACQDLDSSDATSLSPVAPNVNELGSAILTAPIGNIGANYNPTFMWNKVPAATYYRLYIQGSNGSVTDQWYATASICNATTCSVTIPTLEAGNYIWYLQTYNASGLGPWSNNAQPTRFSIKPTTAPAEVILNTPTGTITSHAPTYQWNRVSTATWYRLYISGPDGVVKDQWYQAVNICNPTTCSVAGPTLASGAHVWWVQAYNTAGYSQWSGANFTVSP